MSQLWERQPIADSPLSVIVLMDKVDADAARKDIRQAIQHLERLAAVKSTAERCSLLGSAYKRLTMVEDRAKRSAEAATALAAAAKHYAAAEEIARKNGAADLFYPAKAGIGCELRLAFISGKPCNIAEARLLEVRNSLRQAAADKPDFWSVVGLTELTMLAAVAVGKLAPAAPALIDTLRKLKERVPAPKSWGSVYNEALFVFLPYQAQANSTEQSAAADVLAALKTLAAA